MNLPRQPLGSLIQRLAQPQPSETGKVAMLNDTPFRCRRTRLQVGAAPRRHNAFETPFLRISSLCLRIHLEITLFSTRLYLALNPWVAAGAI